MSDNKSADAIIQIIGVILLCIALVIAVIAMCAAGAVWGILYSCGLWFRALWVTVALSVAKRAHTS